MTSLERNLSKLMSRESDKTTVNTLQRSRPVFAYNRFLTVQDQYLTIYQWISVSTVVWEVILQSESWRFDSTDIEGMNPSLLSAYECHLKHWLDLIEQCTQITCVEMYRVLCERMNEGTNYVFKVQWVAWLARKVLYNTILRFTI